MGTPRQVHQISRYGQPMTSSRRPIVAVRHGEGKDKAQSFCVQIYGKTISS